MKNELLLQSGQDIPFLEAQLIIHNPKIKEIAVIGEDSFWTGCQFLNFSKDNILNQEDKIVLEDKTNFEIFMSIMNSKEKVKYKNDTKMVLALLFPTYELQFTNTQILLKGEYHDACLNNLNFENFKLIINEMFGLNNKDKEKYNPADGMAAKLAERFKKREVTLAKLKGQNIDNNISILSQYISILAVGETKDKNELMNYTVFQLKDEVERFQLKQNFDITLKAKMAGAQDIEEAKNWMGNLYDNSLNA